MSSAPPRFPEIRRDVVFNRSVIFSPARSRRPSDFKSHSPNKSPNPNPNYSTPSCPFCRGREHECAPEIFRIPHETDQWKIRVIENLYPALRRELEPSVLGEGAVIGFGIHDVVIETPFHGVHLPDLSQAEVGEVVVSYRERVCQLAKNGLLEYVQVFKNYGASAGASMTHSHSQIIGLPFVPPTVSARFDSLKEHFDKSGKCGLCEAHSEDILINESNHFSAIVPFAASFPFEVWIIPRDHASYFHDLDEKKAIDFGGLLKLILSKLSKQLNDPPYNFMIHSSPFHLSPPHLPYAHWFMQIVPQLNVIGGFEIGSGCYINPVFPEDAAKVLREVNLTTS
ncbi:ADP-glucose phosphorylase [Phalaenopsis equestris]|uniref:ADP-glucose phosphorylase n=1 Tax=Phalaenopsis equestris TaxID=78828 RepID=UPI0009E4A0B8|nr:ADP-glucose phosphorylase [Phalaenopsis equestris]XP_020580307.1 ADP-glucose phosphorylase [Phalaenopsis equestris]XP_020580308.1 ADP-glucose phosphorylase [Phalaenopsis equestris]